MTDSEAKQMMLDEARDAAQRGDAKELEAALCRASAIDPQDARIWTWLGYVYDDQEQYNAALEAFDKARALDASFAGGYSGAAQTLKALGRLAEAETAMQRALDARPTSAGYVLLGDMQMNQGRDSAAIASFQLALDLDPTNDEAFFNWAVLIRDKDPTAAESMLRKAIAIDPLFGAAHRELGFLMARLRNYPPAEHEVRTAVSLEPSDPWARIYLGNVLWSQGKVAEAEEEFVTACHVAPLWPSPHWLLGMFYAAVDNPAAAERELAMATALDDSDADAAFHLGNFLLGAGRKDEARKWVGRALQLDPQHERARQVRDEFLL
jgi:tetratricopeptide (TPR) repeat protein